MRATSLLRCIFLFGLLLAAPLSLHAGDGLPADAKILRDIPYVTNGHQRQKLDLYLPANRTGGPLLVWIHGGGWVAGSKNDAVPGPQMVALGYSIASLDYRFSSDAPFPAQIEDCKAAIRWLRANAYIFGYDPQRVGAWGGSAGGHLTALLATTGATRDFDVGEHLEQSSAILCGVDFSGPTDFPGWKPASSSPAIQRGGRDSLLTQLLGGEMEKDKMDLAKRASPISWVSKHTAPLYLIHGSADEIVGVEQSETFAAALKTAGAEVVLDIVKDGDHGGKGFWDQERPLRLLEFFSKHLQK